MENASASSVTPNVPCALFDQEQWNSQPVSVPAEMPLTMYLNGAELVTVLCTPEKLNCLVLGFLYTEGIITGLGDLALMRICQEENLADIKLKTSYSPPSRRILTSGCGSGTSFERAGQKVDSDLAVSAEELLALMRQLHRHQEMFQQSGGLHCSTLCDRQRILLAAEDIGRHNTLDKIMGECLLRGIDTRDRILLTTGRISSEMLYKASRMQTPVIVSRSAPTDRAVALGQELGITIAGYARGSRLSVFAGGERLMTPSIR